ncbi:outer mitochondrial membrane transport complex protein-domain-containing protein [Crucibulum laeve]|uniref:Outer mitochondrial membrane transport complex protein-domain-containing protein n=1 Tax=Crucibulum laeve TaxID=68775 RepID=A0A5C3MAJ2_9AGAR|nr:outer mitochondrial membrane transport complex protein-domain-containing protein [Crucibulum laeve]
MSVNPVSERIVLYIWAGQWSLPSFDPLCLATVLFLQVAIPGQFSIAECNDPDLSPTGQLPFLTHDEQTVASFGSIVKYIQGLKSTGKPEYRNAKLDAHLSTYEKSQQTAWIAHIESHMGDLLHYTLYVRNWVDLTHSALVSMFPIPQSYYVPGRLRAAFKPRLEAAGLWTMSEELEEKSKPFTKKKTEEKEDSKRVFAQVFEKDRVLGKAKSILEIYSRLLGDRKYFYNDQPSTIDILLAAHTLLLIKPPYPDSLIKDLVTGSYPNLVAHAQRVHGRTFHETFTPIPLAPQHSSLVSLIPSWRRRNSTSLSEEDARYTRMRWGFYGLAIGGLVAFIAVMGLPEALIPDGWMQVDEEFLYDEGSVDDSDE